MSFARAITVLQTSEIDPHRWLFRSAQRCYPKEVEHAIPVVILGADSPNALGILRSLRKAGVRAIGLSCAARSKVSLSSRHWERTLDVADRVELLGELCKLAQSGQRLPVFCATDDELLWVDDHRDQLRNDFILPYAKGRRLRDLLPKDAILDLGTTAGFCVPKTLKPSEFAQGQEIEFPVMVKALTSDMTSDTGFHRFDSPTELTLWLDETGFGDRQVVLQEYLDPKKYKSFEIQSCIFNGQARVMGVHEKLYASPRQKDGPPIATCMLRRVQTDRFDAPILKLTDYAGLNGPVNTEILVGPRGAFYIESNLRFSLNTPLDTVAGVNLPYLVYREWLGLPQNESDLVSERAASMMYEHASVLYFLRFAGQGRWVFLKDVLGASKRLYFQSNDPVPFGHMVMELGPKRAIEAVRNRFFSSGAEKVGLRAVKE